MSLFAWHSIVGLARLTIATCAVTASLSAQPSSDPASVATRAVGSRVRVSQPPTEQGRPEYLMGTLIEPTPHYLRVVRAGGDTASVPLQAVTRIEVSVGRHRRVATAAVIGAFGGGAGAAALAALTYQPASCPPEQWLCLDLFDRSDSALIGGVLGAALGTVGGLLVGITRDPNRWQTVFPGTAPGRVTVAPLLGRVQGVRVGVSF